MQIDINFIIRPFYSSVVTHHSALLPRVSPISCEAACLGCAGQLWSPEADTDTAATGQPQPRRDPTPDICPVTEESVTQSVRWRLESDILVWVTALRLWRLEPHSWRVRHQAVIANNAQEEVMMMPGRYFWWLWHRICEALLRFSS